MAKYTSIQIPKIIAALKSAITDSLIMTGNESIDILQRNEAESDVTHRLKDSFSWATKAHKSDLGPEAEEGDGVDKPTEPYTMVIGTQVPYATSVNYGTVGRFTYGKNGAPSNFTELKKAIIEWLKTKIANGSFSVDGETKISTLAYKIAKDIEQNGTDAHPFWDASVVDIKQLAKANITEYINVRLSAIPDAVNNIKVGVS